MEVFVMREKKLILSLSFSLMLILLFVGTALAYPMNWGDVDGSTNVVPVVRTDSLGGDTYYSDYGREQELEFTVNGGSFPDPGYFTWNSPAVGDTFDVLILRTTSVSGDLDGTVWYSGSDEIGLVFEKDEEVSGDFTLSTNIPWVGLGHEESSDVTFIWDFTLEEGRFMSGTLYAREIDMGTLYGDTAICDFGVVLLEETPTFDIMVGDTSMEHPLFSKTVDSLDQNIDLGPVFLRGYEKINVVFANFWNEQIVLESGQDIYIEDTYFAPSLYDLEDGDDDDDDGPAVVQVNSSTFIDPALALQIMLHDMDSEILKSGSFDIKFTDGSGVTHLSWFRCYPSIQDGPNAAGMGMYPPASADVNAQITTHVSEVLWANNFDNPTSLENFNLISSADEGQFLGQVSMNISVPGRYEGQVVAVPVGFRLGIAVEEFENYDAELAQAIDSELGENPAEEEMEAAIRKYFSFKKEWSTGETAQIRLNDEEFKDAFRIFFEYDGDEVEGVYFTANLLIVNGGTSGEVDSVTVDGRTYIVIYDGTLDDRFADPIKIVAAYEEDTSGSSGDGCSAFGLVPAAGLLLLPLLMLLKK